MLYIDNSISTDPHFNLAVEEYVLKNLNSREEYLLLWQNEPAIIIGRHQNTLAEINLDYVQANKIHVVRRLSGEGPYTMTWEISILPSSRRRCRANC